MDLLDNITSKRPLSSLQRPDVIEYQSDYIPKDIFIVYGSEKDDTIPALLVQLWKFEGGYNHGIYNIVVNDLGVNTSVSIFEPKKIVGQIIKILNYRSNIQTLTDKEVFVMNMKPSELLSEKNDEFCLPYECVIITEQGEMVLNIPDWTPEQRLPVDRIKIGTFIEIWEIQDKLGIMKVLKL